MSNKAKLSLVALAVVWGAAQTTVAQETGKGDGFIEGSSLTLTNRNFFFNRDFRHGQSSATGNGYSEEWAHGVMAVFESGFTQGTVGFGVDAFAMLGLKLDTGSGRSGAGGSIDLLPHNSSGEAAENYSKLGGAAKVRLFDTVLKVGDVFPITPVVQYGDSRLLPESFKGITLENSSFEGLTLQGGRLHAMSQPNTSSMRDEFVTFYGGQVNSPWIGYLGGDYTVNEYVKFSLYTSRLKDAWDQYYFSTSASYPLSDTVALIGTFNYYKAVDEGKELLGRFNTNIWSASTGIQFGAHTVAVAYQRNNGNNDFDYLRQADSIYLNNSIQYSDFNSPKEQSWQLRYDLDMTSYGVPGLSFMTRYARGWDADYSQANDVYMRTDDEGNPLTNQKRWERNVEIKYVVQTGTLKDMSFRMRQATTRATSFESDLDEVRLIVEYPLEIL
ncbi:MULTISPECIES: OprD family porin [Pseudomonas]|uniref:Outer membrane porin n=1 Tax=Pseudomonas luteola TaxID=47886 RepID=A0A2X2EA48_PSELU|nr:MULTISPECIES: OprD family porin [Pseudomonas]SPZ05029.1 outer membrane porin [Pseudomonas luteola]